eukprot:TRINITY_DN93_c0_g1_i1.p1 TRINITY_DN93_c0_g1~~TRINITY_DN93_c0_g1_i1.p1  ORF type:complete len:277 (+),score=55.38 TRINITY_DN93_c0_g1_i1:119-949(+)
MSSDTTSTPTVDATTLSSALPTEDADVIKPEPTTETKATKREVTSTPTKTAVSQSKEVEAARSYVSILKSDPLYGEVQKILLWRDPVKTGLLFGIFNFFFFLSTWAEYSFVTIVSYLLLTLLCICFGYSNYVVQKATWFQGKRVENPFTERFKDAKFHVSRETVDKHLTTVLDLTNTTIDKFRDVFYCNDNFLSLRFAAYFYLAATIGNWFSGATLVYLVSLGAFVWPRLYEEKQKEIDQFYGIAVAQADTYYKLALSKLPPAVTQRFPQLKPKTN